MLRLRHLIRNDVARTELEPYEPPDQVDAGEFEPIARGQSAGHDLQA